MIRSLKSVIAPGIGDLPGGKVGAEESLEAAITREIKEETEISVSQLNKICDYRWMHKDQEYHEYLFCAFTTIQTITLNPKEHKSYLWVPFNKLNESSLHPNIKKLLHLMQNIYISYPNKSFSILAKLKEYIFHYLQ